MRDRSLERERRGIHREGGGRERERESDGEKRASDLHRRCSRIKCENVTQKLVYRFPSSSTAATAMRLILFTKSKPFGLLNADLSVDNNILILSVLTEKLRRFRRHGGFGRRAFFNIL